MSDVTVHRLVQGFRALSRMDGFIGARGRSVWFFWAGFGGTLHLEHPWLGVLDRANPSIYTWQRPWGWLGFFSFISSLRERTLGNDSGFGFWVLATE